MKERLVYLLLAAVLFHLCECLAVEGNTRAPVQAPSSDRYVRQAFSDLHNSEAQDKNEDGDDFFDLTLTQAASAATKAPSNRAGRRLASPSTTDTTAKREQPAGLLTLGSCRRMIRESRDANMPLRSCDSSTTDSHARVVDSCQRASPSTRST
jgi:hypothetical protein